MATIIRAAAGYFVLLITVRILRRRPGSQMTVFEFVLIFLIGGIIILSTVQRDRSTTNCTCAVITVALIHRILAWAKSRSQLAGRILDGTPLVIIRKGEWQHKIATAMKITREDVAIAAREAGLRKWSQIDYAVLERNGRISVLPK